ncbi:hypothetical protein [Cylindrospermopsis curvispora]|uniref:Uncharacterized protein n=1 Tax=Cylindrospermopsis curvispora GIHE-G1 TaxID=2666332 RepID=A0A7H0EYN4_9CYAN|nr:hypothetical protein [Cylindrospermopsis curvispora]QNP28900.1 hypothetical protein IAR63_13665 [Cylindrospermopsis curvispora GIHE-G1]
MTTLSPGKGDRLPTSSQGKTVNLLLVRGDGISGRLRSTPCGRLRSTPRGRSHYTPYEIMDIGLIMKRHYPGC